MIQAPGTFNPYTAASYNAVKIDIIGATAGTQPQYTQPQAPYYNFQQPANTPAAEPQADSTLSVMA